MHRFYLPGKYEQKSNIVFPKDCTRQIYKVLRLSIGDCVEVLDGLGNAYEVQLTQVTGEHASGTIKGHREVDTEPDANVFLYFSVTQRAKMEWILQKCTEIGAAGFTPVVTERSLSREKSIDRNKQIRREMIIKEAVEQSGRAVLPTLRAPISFDKMVSTAPDLHDVVFIASTDIPDHNIKAAVQAIKSKAGAIRTSPSIAIIIGPEGGFTEKEIEQAKGAGFVQVTMGPRILRMETAAITAVALVLNEMGEMGG